MTPQIRHPSLEARVAHGPIDLSADCSRPKGVPLRANSETRTDVFMSSPRSDRADDVAQRKPGIAAHALKPDRERRLDLALKASRLHVWTFDIGAHRLVLADALCAALSLDAKQCGRPGAWRRRVHPEDRQRVERAFRECLAGGPELDVEFRVLHASGRIDWLALRAALMKDGETGPHLYGVCADITERARMERERDQFLVAERAARERAEAATSVRDQFLSIVSHELRSPLNGIQNWSNVLETQLPADAPNLMLRALTGIRTGIDQQVRLIEDLLDATRIMSGKLSLSPTTIEIRPLVEAAIASVSEAAVARNIEILPALHLVREQMHGDPHRFQQIVWNLLSNALKFTPPGGHVRVSLDRVGAMLRLQVSDDGKGIAPEFLPSMFNWFGRAETSSQRSQDGIGLGLALVRHLCEMHGGHVSATSAGPSMGATFEVRLPLLIQRGSARPDISEADEIAKAPHSFPSLAGLRVVLIDDQEDSLEAVAALLSSMNAQVQAFASGEAFLQWLVPQGAQRCADVVLCDIAMPGQDGYATLARIREHENKLGLADAERLRVIALTAFAQAEVRQRALAAGFALHLAKPVGAEELARSIRSIALGGAEA